MCMYACISLRIGERIPSPTTASSCTIWSCSTCVECLPYSRRQMRFTGFCPYLIHTLHALTCRKGCGRVDELTHHVLSHGEHFLCARHRRPRMTAQERHQMAVGFVNKIIFLKSQKVWQCKQQTRCAGQETRGSNVSSLYNWKDTEDIKSMGRLHPIG